MKCFKHIGMGLLRALGTVFLLCTFPIWMPIIILHDIGCDDRKDEWVREGL